MKMKPEIKCAFISFFFVRGAQETFCGSSQLEVKIFVFEIHFWRKWNRLVFVFGPSTTPVKIIKWKWKWNRAARFSLFSFWFLFDDYERCKKRQRKIIPSFSFSCLINSMIQIIRKTEINYRKTNLVPTFWSVYGPKVVLILILIVSL